MRKFISLLFFLFVSGCATKPQIVMLFIHPPIYPKGYIPLNVGVKLFKDARAEEEKKITQEITDFAQEVTALITKDLREAELFKTLRINYDPQNTDLILTGEINSFYWKSLISPTTKLPYIKYIHDIGVASGEGEGEVTITFILVDPENQKELARYKESTKTKRSYKKNEARSSGSETAQALREVIEKFIQDLLQDKEKILEVLSENCDCKE